jgi:large subunit ribosomal protein L25
MPTTVQLKTKNRTASGKGGARKLRQDRRVPGVIYGKGVDPIPVEIDEREFLRSVSGHAVSNLIIDLGVEGTTEPVKALIREIQTDPLSGAVVHVDLNRISMTEKIEVEVPLEVTGIPAGVKDEGGVLQHPVRALLVKCLVINIPEIIAVDASGLHIGDAIHVRDLDVPGVEIMENPDRTVVSVLAPTVIKEDVVEEAAEGEEGAAEPELVGKKKEDSEEGGKD